ncbi:MAG: cysteine desulfurase NifS [Christensenellales bacterium]|jgi:cysteine desulfurase
MSIYFDHAATAPLDKEVLAEMMPYFGVVYGNANSQHSFGQEAAKAVLNARRRISQAIGAPHAKYLDIYFTSGGTEADNWAIRGIASAYREKGNHIITSQVEHPAVYNTCKILEKQGFEVTYLPVDEGGQVRPETLEKAITDRTILVSIMFANNEIGTVMPIKELVKVAKAKKVLFHTDAVQATGSVPINVSELGVDLMSISAHKFYGPKGIGALYVRPGVKIDRIISGGEQERTLRGGTSNVPAIVGFGAAIEAAVRDMEKNNAHIKALRDSFVEKLMARVPDIRLNGTMESRLPNNANFSFRYIEGESILISLDLAGIAVSSGSACSSSSLEPSRTLIAIGVPVGTAHGSLRFTFGRENTMEEVDYAVEKIAEIVARLRAWSPLAPRN